MEISVRQLWNFGFGYSSCPNTGVFVSGLVLALKYVKVHVIRILFARSAHSHPHLRRIALLKINCKNSGEMARNEVVMKTKSFGFMNLGRLKFR